MDEIQEDAETIYEDGRGCVFITSRGSLGIEVGGKVVVMSLSQWVNCAWPPLPFGEVH